MKYEARVEITHLPGIADPQGATVERSLPALGYDNVSHVRVGKSIRLLVDASDEAAALAQVDEMCRRLLANPVIEAYEIELSEPVSAATAASPTGAAGAGARDGDQQPST
ncbi:MAG TPA: phosphoribosylformylglycinamidine synthase subunit PurS [Acidimicrobiia bacterium]|jgi:phosphoribosylformylglycinamidine synthase PurS subunit|nr:phosphoribosylformylglycinamidine synthase subunit PurS [Acidimicrobiia bacterium]